jgi:excisionase family DNA binding protein
MAKMFYSLEEAAQKLRRPETKVLKLVEEGRLQEFRDRDRLMFKREQVDLLAGDGDDLLNKDRYYLVDEGKGAEGFGDLVADADPDELTLESVGSGSGLLDLMRGADDTSLGADLMMDVYTPDEILEHQGSSGHKNYIDHMRMPVDPSEDISELADRATKLRAAVTEAEEHIEKALGWRFWEMFGHIKKAREILSRVLGEAK